MKSFLYLFIFTTVAFSIGWLFLNISRPQLIEAGCAEIAQKSSDILFKKQEPLNPEYQYHQVKERCLKDSLK